MKVIIDRFEGKYAVVEVSEGIFENLPAVLVPGAHEGDVIDIRIDADETESRRTRINKLKERLFED